MTSPSAPTAATPSRRLQRSARLVVAVALLVLAVAAVAAAALSGSWLVATIAAALGTLLGIAATRITYTEVADTRRAWARDRAGQAQDYLALTTVRTEEQAVYVTDTQGRITRHEATISRLEKRLADAAVEVIAAREQAAAERDKAAKAAASATAERERLEKRLEDAEERAAMAVVRVAELEQELDIVLAEWRAGHTAPQRKRA